MKQLSRVLFFVLWLAAACSPVPPGPDGATAVSNTPVPLDFPLSLSSGSEQIQQAMRVSATRWGTVWMDGTLTQLAADGVSAAEIYREQAWIDLTTGRFRVLMSGPEQGPAEIFKAGDGVTIVTMDINSGQSQSESMPEIPAGAFVPPLQEGVAHPQPLWGAIGSRISELAFSSNFAQNKGTFTPLQMDQVAGRETLMVEWTFIENTLPSWRMWLDTRTAVILKMQNFDKQGGTTLRSERTVHQVIYDAVFEDALFAAPSQTPQFSSEGCCAGGAPGGGSTPIAAETGLPSGTGTPGELYFFTLPHQPGGSVQLVRLPGACVTGGAACPQLESIPAPFAFNFNLSALAWSPDGSLAAFAYPDHASGTPYKLWIFEPVAKTWTSVAQFPFIDPPFWSPDGTWLAFRVQDGVGGENVYVVHRDGTGLRNITDSGILPTAGRPYVMDGWLTENIILRPALPDSEATVYLARAADGAVRPLFDTLLTKAVFVASPDGAWLAYDDYDYQSQKHALRVVEPDGAHPLDLASFAGGSLYPIVWSPDGTRLAFAHSSTDANFNPLSDVYVIGRDGLGMTQVYKGVTVGRLVFSPDGNFLLVEETTSPTGGHLFAVNLGTLEARILLAPGLTLDTDWYAPSWRP